MFPGLSTVVSVAKKLTMFPGSSTVGKYGKETMFPRLSAANNNNFTTGPSLTVF